MECVVNKKRKGKRGEVVQEIAEYVNENETPSVRNETTIDSLLSGLLIQTAVGGSSGLGILPLNLWLIAD